MLRYGLVILLCAASLAQASDPDALLADLGRRYDEEVTPLFEQYCLDCHAGDEAEAGVDLAGWESGAAAAAADEELWDRVMKRISAREMPPEGSPKPSNQQINVVQRWIEELPKESAENCERLATDATQRFFRGYVMSRRLTRGEYARSIRDLFGVAMAVEDELPSDGAGGEGFDTAGAALFTSPILMEKYLRVAQEVAATVLPDESDGLAPEIAAARERILSRAPSDSAAPREAARAVLEHFAYRAYRRPLTAGPAGDVERLLVLFDRVHDRGDGFLPALRHALAGVLISPHFLFLAEPEPEAEGVYRLGPYQLASRLAYFLWSAPPDEALLAAAASGDLHDQEELLRQTERMLADPRSNALGERFAVQWLELGELGKAKRPDEHAFPDYDEELADAMRGESVAAFNYVFRENRSVLELIDSDYTFVNARLAHHYGLPAPEGAGFVRVSLPDRSRGGLATHAGVLTATSYPLRTSPVLRGKWVAEVLLGERIPPPPPDVPALAEDETELQAASSLRERLEQHRTNPTCAACHQKLDPIGFGLENFDAVGRWRTHDSSGEPIDAGGKLPSGDEFSGPAELKDVLLQRKEDFIRRLARKMLGYALGRELNKFDECVIDDAVAALEENDYQSRALVAQIVLSYPFQHRYVAR